MLWKQQQQVSKKKGQVELDTWGHVEATEPLSVRLYDPLRFVKKRVEICLKMLKLLYDLY
jgi:hypothetical protein